VRAVLHGYGYEVKIPRQRDRQSASSAGKSESKRLFAADHEMAAQMPPDLRKKLAFLKDGPDRIEIESGDRRADGLAHRRDHDEDIDPGSRR